MFVAKILNVFVFLFALNAIECDSEENDNLAGLTRTYSCRERVDENIEINMKYIQIKQKGALDLERNLTMFSSYYEKICLTNLDLIIFMTRRHRMLNLYKAQKDIDDVLEKIRNTQINLNKINDELINLKNKREMLLLVKDIFDLMRSHELCVGDFDEMLYTKCLKIAHKKLKENVSEMDEKTYEKDFLEIKLEYIEKFGYSTYSVSVSKKFKKEYTTLIRKQITETKTKINSLIKENNEILYYITRSNNRETDFCDRYSYGKCYKLAHKKLQHNESERKRISLKLKESKTILKYYLLQYSSEKDLIILMKESNKFQITQLNDQTELYAIKLKKRNFTTYIIGE